MLWSCKQGLGLRQHSRLVLSRSRVTGPKFGRDLKIRAQVLGIGFQIKFLFKIETKNNFWFGHVYCIVFSDSTQYLCSRLRRPTCGLGLLCITGTNMVIASLLTEFNVIYEVVSQCIMILDIYRYSFRDLEWQILVTISRTVSPVLTLSQDQAVKILGLVSRFFVVLITRLSFAAPNP